MTDFDPIHLRDCPMCKTPPSDNNGPQITSTCGIELSTGKEWGALGYTAQCVQCGTSVSDEYLDEVVRLWNGKPELDHDEVQQ